jgi:hypothetical protein
MSATSKVVPTNPNHSGATLCATYHSKCEGPYRAFPSAPAGDYLMPNMVVCAKHVAEWAAAAQEESESDPMV